MADFNRRNKETGTKNTQLFAEMKAVGFDGDHYGIQMNLVSVDTDILCGITFLNSVLPLKGACFHVSRGFHKG